MSNPVRDNTELQRFEMDVDGDVAIAKYRLSPGVVAITHTEVPEALNGRGYGSAMVRGALDLIRARAQKVRPACPFVSWFIRNNPEYQDLLQ